MLAYAKRNGSLKLFFTISRCIDDVTEEEE